MAGGKSTSVLVALVFVSGIFLATPLAQAQDYPPPTPTPRPRPTPKPKCSTPGEVVKGNFRPGQRFQRGDTVAMRGGRGCVGPRQRVDLAIRRGKSVRRIGGAASTKNGAFTVSGKISPRTSLGKHKLVVTSGNKRYAASIEIVAGGGSRRALASGPMLGVWAALIGLIGVYAVGARRRRTPVAAMSAPAELEVPRIDTWDFVGVLPERRARTRKPAGRKGGRKPPRATAKSKPKAAKPKAGASRAASPARTADRKKATTKATPTNRRTGSKAPKGAAAKAQPKRKPPKKK